jgi:tetratricopeptide (TPR) repeat protein
MTQVDGGNVPLFTREACLNLCQYLVKGNLLSVEGMTNALAYHSSSFGLDRKSVEDGAKLFMGAMVSRSSNMQLGMSIGDFVRQWLAESGRVLPPHVSGTDVTRISARQPRSPATPPRACIGRYPIIKPLESGGMGAVYLCEHPDLPGNKVAVKIIKPEVADDEALTRFRLEAETLWVLSHPNLLRCYEVQLREPPYFIVMPFVEGGTLNVLMQKRKASGDLLWRIKTMVAICRGVQAMHAAGKVHRDLKPKNIFITADGQPIVGDPGLVKKMGAKEAVVAVGDQIVASELTQFGSILGTIPYMAPEQASGDLEKITFASDVYSLVKILFEIITGEQVHTATTAMGILAKVLDAKIPDHVPATLRRKVYKSQRLERLIAIIEKGLQFEPKDRYQTAGEVADELEQYATELQTYEEEERKRKLAEHEAMRKRFRLIAGIAAGGLLTAFLALLASVYLARAKKAEARAAQEARGREAEALARVEAEANARAADALRLGVAVDFTEAQVLVKAALWAEAETALLALIERDPQFAPGRRLLAEVQFNQQNSACADQWEWLAEHGPTSQRSEAAFFAFFTCQQVTVVEPNDDAKRQHQARLRRHLDAVTDEPYKTLGEVANSISTAEDLFRDRKPEEGKAELANGVRRLEDMVNPGRLVWLSDYIQGFLLQTQALIASREQSAGSRERCVMLYNEARAKFESSSAVNADFPLSHFYLADVLNQLGEPRAAMASFQRVQRLMPYHAPARYMHAECLSELGLREQDPAEQTRFANRALQLCRQVEEMNRFTNPRQPVQCGRAKIKALILKIGASLRLARQGTDETRAELQRTIESMRTLPALNDMDRAVLQNAVQVLDQTR